MKQRLRRAWAHDDDARALEQLRALASEFDRTYPGAAGSLREGMVETLTLTRLGVGGNLKRTLEVQVGSGRESKCCEGVAALIEGAMADPRRL